MSQGENGCGLYVQTPTLFDIFTATKEHVGKNVNDGISVVVPKTKKMSYVEAARTTHIVDNQNRLIANGDDLMDH